MVMETELLDRWVLGYSENYASYAHVAILNFVENTLLIEPNTETIPDNV